jgi:isopentenyl-diphosphate delta-isomerase
LGQTFADWGLPTAECLENIHQLNLPVSLIASGGIQNGLEVAKAIALGADLVGLARPFLQAAAESSEAVYTLADILMAEMKTALFCTGNANFQQLRQSQCWEKIQ